MGRRFPDHTVRFSQPEGNRTFAEGVGSDLLTGGDDPRPDYRHQPVDSTAQEVGHARVERPDRTGRGHSTHDQTGDPENAMMSQSDSEIYQQGKVQVDSDMAQYRAALDNT